MASANRKDAAAVVEQIRIPLAQEHSRGSAFTRALYTRAITIGLYFPDMDVVSRLDAEAVRRGFSRARMARVLIEEGLNGSEWCALLPTLETNP